MREPVFNETMQLGIVVRDLEATVRRYEDDYGIGPWRFDRIDLGEANDYREYGEPAERSNRIAIAMVGRVMWELIEPLDEDGIYARFLAEKGEGIHHVAVATPDFDETAARAERKDDRLPRHTARPGGDHRDLQRHARRRTRAGRDVAAILGARNETKRARLSGHRLQPPLYSPYCLEVWCSRKSGPAVCRPRRTRRSGREDLYPPIYLLVDAPPPVPQYYRQGKPMEGESRWES
jgi:methylmalonyl-CoA/ethylmalonyl-CoA epimerase